jgi:hypothetical protein
MNTRYTYDFINEYGEWEMGMQAWFCDRNSAEKLAIEFMQTFNEDVRFKADNQTEYQYIYRDVKPKMTIDDAIKSLKYTNKQ